MGLEIDDHFLGVFFFLVDFWSEFYEGYLELLNHLVRRSESGETALVSGDVDGDDAALVCQHVFVRFDKIKIRCWRRVILSAEFFIELVGGLTDGGVDLDRDVTQVVQVFSDAKLGLVG